MLNKVNNEKTINQLLLKVFNILLDSTLQSIQYAQIQCEIDKMTNVKEIGLCDLALNLNVTKTYQLYLI